ARPGGPGPPPPPPGVDVRGAAGGGGAPAGVFAAGPAQRHNRLGRAGHFGTPTATPSAMPEPLISTWPAANIPVFTATIRVVSPSTTWTPKPPLGSASSAATGTASTSSRLSLTKSTSTGAASSGPRAFWSAIVTVTSMVAVEAAGLAPTSGLVPPPGVVPPGVVPCAVTAVPTRGIFPLTVPRPGTVTGAVRPGPRRTPSAP